MFHQTCLWHRTRAASSMFSDLQSLVFFFFLHPTEREKFQPKLMTPLYSHSLYNAHSRAASAAREPNSHSKPWWQNFDSEWDWLTLHHTELWHWVRSQVCWCPDIYWPVSLGLPSTSKSQKDLQGGPCIWQNCRWKRGKKCITICSLCITQKRPLRLALGKHLSSKFCAGTYISTGSWTAKAKYGRVTKRLAPPQWIEAG